MWYNYFAILYIPTLYLDDIIITKCTDIVWPEQQANNGSSGEESSGAKAVSKVWNSRLYIFIIKLCRPGRSVGRKRHKRILQLGHNNYGGICINVPIHSVLGWLAELLLYCWTGCE